MDYGRPQLQDHQMKDSSKNSEKRREASENNAIEEDVKVGTLQYNEYRASAASNKSITRLKLAKSLSRVGRSKQNEASRSRAKPRSNSNSRPFLVKRPAAPRVCVLRSLGYQRGPRIPIVGWRLTPNTLKQPWGEARCRFRGWIWCVRVPEALPVVPVVGLQA